MTIEEDIKTQEDLLADCRDYHILREISAETMKDLVEAQERHDEKWVRFFLERKVAVRRATNMIAMAHIEKKGYKPHVLT